jgi:hypothetical protein
VGPLPFRSLVRCGRTAAERGRDAVGDLDLSAVVRLEATSQRPEWPPARPRKSVVLRAHLPVTGTVAAPTGRSGNTKDRSQHQ